MPGLTVKWLMFDTKKCMMKPTKERWARVAEGDHEGGSVMEILKDFKKHFVLVSILYIVLGIVLIIWPSLSLKLVCYFFGIMTVLYGVVQLFRYFSINKEFRTFQLDLFVGIICLVFGVFALAKPSIVASILPVIVGIFFLMEAVIKIQNALGLKKGGYDQWWTALAVSVLVAVLGILLLINPFSAMKTFVIVIGICLIADGAASFWSVYCVSKRVKEFKKMEEVMNDVLNQ